MSETTGRRAAAGRPPVAGKAPADRAAQGRPGPAAAPARPASPPGATRRSAAGALEGEVRRPQPPPPTRSWLRPTIRFRLTALYGGMFLLAGVALLIVVYMLASHSMHAQTASVLQRAVDPNAFYQAPSLPGIRLTGQQFSDYVQNEANAQQHQELGDLLQHMLIALLVFAVIAFAFGYVIAGRVLQPLGRITRTARQVAGSDLHRRIEMEGPDDELKELADTFDEMLNRLDRAFDAQRRFVANASHELRTPLAINRTLLEVQLADPEASEDLRQLGRTLLATNERSEALVEGLLLLAKSENKLVDRKPVDLAEVATRALEQARPEAEKRRVTLRDELAPAVALGNGVLLERIALNLVQNGVRYNEPDGWVEISTVQQGNRSVLTVANTGPVVPQYELDNIFEPFRRLGGSRTGSDKGAGLGLSIVRSVVRVHGGAIVATPRSEGGLVMRVELPAR